jgi:hypothetical protein
MTQHRPPVTPFLGSSHPGGGHRGSRGRRPQRPPTQQQLPGPQKPQSPRPPGPQRPQRPHQQQWLPRPPAHLVVALPSVLLGGAARRRCSAALGGSAVRRLGLAARRLSLGFGSSAARRSALPWALCQVLGSPPCSLGVRLAWPAPPVRPCLGPWAESLGALLLGEFASLRLLGSWAA